ncbi:MAG: energy-coupling factor ABC transporter permease [SAR324 cluster bacterium]|nr:energy-coupling factor ABC transporter permease [SAR324 cluster bacterium]
MHIEPGFISQTKVLLANVGAVAIAATYAKEVIFKPTMILKTILVGLFFSIFMQIFHLPVGPSEIHFIGAMAVYLVFGFYPTLFGFMIGLGLQGLVFAPTDLAHLAVNSLSLVLPLMAVHYTVGSKITAGAKLNLKTLLKLDAIFYSGVTLMVGFWLVGSGVTTFAAWGAFATSYLPVVFVEPIFTLAIITVLKRFDSKSWVTSLTAVKQLKLA